jgi:hypothetical protein
MSEEPSSPILAMVLAPGTWVPSLRRYFWWLRVFCSLTIFWPAALKRSGSMVATTLRLRAGALRLRGVAYDGMWLPVDLCVVRAGLGRGGRGLAHVKAVGLRAAAVAPGDEVKDLDRLRLQGDAGAEAGRVPAVGNYRDFDFGPAADVVGDRLAV